MMATRFLLTLAVCAALFTSGCTIRYSQSLAGAIPQTTGSQVRSSDTGFTLFGIAIVEPTPAHKQVVSLLGTCSQLTKVQVDYRELFFLILGIPRVTVTANCVR